MGLTNSFSLMILLSYSRVRSIKRAKANHAHAFNVELATIIKAHVEYLIMFAMMT